jgi:hypothetical protein
MKKLIGLGLIGLWILFASLCLAYWLIHHSAGVIPNPPEAFWLWLIDAMDAHNRKTDVVILVGLLVSIPIVSAVTLLGRFLWCRLQGARTRHRS